MSVFTGISEAVTNCSWLTNRLGPRTQKALVFVLLRRFCQSVYGGSLEGAKNMIERIEGDKQLQA